MVSTTNLVAYWKMDDASGAIVDSHGSYDGTNTGASYGATGIINDCLDFESSEGDHVTVASFPALNGNFSISFWLKPESANPANAYPLNKGTDKICQLYNGNLYTIDNSVFTAITAGSWQHFVITYEAGQTPSLIMYKNGSSVDSSNWSNSYSSSTGTFYMGDESGFSKPYDGLMDEVAVWTRTLTPTEVSDLYNSGAGLAYPFSSDITINPSPFALSFSEEVPTYFLDLSPISLSSSVSLKTAGVEGATQISINLGTIRVGSGSIGSQFISRNYPAIEGLIAGTTKQTRKPNL